MFSILLFERLYYVCYIDASPAIADLTKTFHSSINTIPIPIDTITTPVTVILIIVPGILCCFALFIQFIDFVSI